MATPLGTTFFTDEKVVAQGDVTFTGKMVELLVIEFDQAKIKSSSLLAPSALGRDSTAKFPRRSTFKSLRRLPWRWSAQRASFLAASRKAHANISHETLEANIIEG